MLRIGPITKALSEWKDDLLGIEVEALSEYGYYDPYVSMSADEVFECIIDYKGGIASGFELRSLVSRVYGVEL